MIKVSPVIFSVSIFNLFELIFLDPKAKDDVNKKAFEKTLQTIKTDTLVQDKPSERYNSKLQKIKILFLNSFKPWFYLSSW